MKKRGQGCIFSAPGFLDLGSQSTVTTALWRMAATVCRPTLPFGNKKAGFGQRRGFYSRSVTICQTIKKLLLKRQREADFKGQPTISVKSPKW
jgi:hypothetical protein